MSAKAYEIVGIGEVLWDVFPSGPRFGGAPANFACSAAGLGRDRVRAGLVSAVGRDKLGEDALVALKDHGVDTSCVPTLEYPTGQVLVQLDDSGSASYEFAMDCAWDNLTWSDELQACAERVDVVCFGTLGQRSAPSRDVIRRFVGATSSTAIRVFDINLRKPFFNDEVIIASLELANVLKLNADELPHLANLCQLTGDDMELLQRIGERFQLRAVALTRGPDGAALWSDAGVVEHAGVATKVVDTVGAGDAFTATLALGLLDDAPAEIVNRHACQVAAYVCGQSGATPTIPKRLVPAPTWGHS